MHRVHAVQDARAGSGNVYFFHDGKISAVDSYYEASEALEAVGLSE